MQFPPQFDEEARDLVQRLLTKDPSLRLGSGEEVIHIMYWNLLRRE